MAEKTRDADATQETGEMTVAEARRAARSSDVTAAGEAHLAELRRAEGPRPNVMRDMRSTAQRADDALGKSETGQHFMMSDLEHAASVFETTPAMARAVFAYTLRSRLTEDEFRAALDTVREREV